MPRKFIENPDALDNDNGRNVLYEANNEVVDEIEGGGGGGSCEMIGLFQVIPTGTFYFVRPDGSDADDGLSYAEAKASIQAAVDAASAGDTIFVFKGTYELTAEINVGKAVKIIGVEGAEKTIIQPVAGTDIRCMYIHTTNEAEVYGFTFQNGRSLYTSVGENSGNGGGVCIWLTETNTAPIGSFVSDCIVKDCYADQYGGGVYLMDKRASCINSIVKDCSTGTGGYQGGGGVGLRYEGYLYNSIVKGCSSPYGAVMSYQGTCRIENSIVKDNTAIGTVLFQGSGHILYNSIVVDNEPSNILLLYGSADIKRTCSSPLPAGTLNTDIVPEFQPDTFKLVEGSPLSFWGMPRDWLKYDIENKPVGNVISIGAYRNKTFVTAETE